MKTKTLKSRYRILSLLLAVMLVASSLALATTTVSAAALDDSGTSGGCSWKLTGTQGNLTLTIGQSGNGVMADYDWEDHPWNDQRKSIKTLVIEDGVTAIGAKAFWGFTSLATISLPDSVTTIGDNAFRECLGLTTLDLSSVVSIGRLAFYYCINLESIFIPASVESIGERAFLAADGYESFVMSCKLKEFVVDKNNLYYSAQDGVLYDKDMSLLIRYPLAKKETVFSVPATVETIGFEAFTDCINLEHVIIPNSVKTIDISAFDSCRNIKNLDLASVQNIERSAFHGCTSLTSLTIPGSTKSIGDAAFQYCTGLKDVTFSSSDTSIHDYTFLYCQELSKVTFLGSKPSDFGSNIFEGCASDLTLYVPADDASWDDIESYPDVAKVVRVGGNIPDTTPSTPQFPSISMPSYGNSSSTSSGSSRSSRSSNNSSSSMATSSRRASSAATTAVNSALTAARASGADTAIARLVNFGDISLADLQAMAKQAGNMQLKLNADSINGNAVDVRISFNPAKATIALNLTASTVNPSAVRTNNLFKKFFSNNVMSVVLGQQGSFGTSVEIAAKRDPKLNTSDLVFYTYNPATNSYTQIANPDYWVDRNGYVHFTTSIGGTIIISDGVLAKA